MKRTLAGAVSIIIIGLLAPMAYALEVNEFICVDRIVEGYNIDYDYSYPQFGRTVNEATTKVINTNIRELAQKYVVNATIQSKENPTKVYGKLKFEVKTNTPSLISIVYQNHLEWEGFSADTVKGLTLDAVSGNKLRLEDLFKDDSFVQAANDYIKAEIEKQGLTDKLVEEFKGISKNHNFYLTPEHLVIVYNPQELLPAQYGPVEFKIPIEKLALKEKYMN